MPSSSDTKRAEGLGVLLGFIVMVAAMVWAFDFVPPLSLHHHEARTRAVAAEVVADATTLPPTDYPVMPAVPLGAGVVMEYQCPNNPAMRFSVGAFGWTRSGDPVVYASPSTNGLTQQALLELFATACV